jgi:hypothetical protein
MRDLAALFREHLDRNLAENRECPSAEHLDLCLPEHVEHVAPPAEHVEHVASSLEHLEHIAPPPEHMEHVELPRSDGRSPETTRPGALSTDPPAPVVDDEATVTLAKLELVGTGPGLRAGSGPQAAIACRLVLAHPTECSPELRALAERHQADITTLLAYRALIEQLRPAIDGPPPMPRGREGEGREARRMGLSPRSPLR